jgi:dUTP pyrophosphatase
MKIQWKKLHENAKLPYHAKEGDAGVDLVSVSVMIGNKSEIEYRTGLAVQIPKGYVGLLFMRSSVFNKDIDLTNAVGVLDSGYRGEIMFKYTPNFDYWDYALKRKDFQTSLELGEILYHEHAEDELRGIVLGADTYAVGERIGQLVIVPYVEIESEFVEELEESERGTGGYGSTGN